MATAASSSWSIRRGFVLFGFAMLAVGLVVRASYLQIFDYEFYRGEGEARQLRSVAIPAHRGDILDRSGDPLAISTPIQSLWGVPKELVEQPGAMREVAALLQIDATRLNQRIAQAVEWGKEFIYVKRHVLPETVNKIQQLNIAALSVQREYRRYYPSGSAASHLIGITGIDDEGREGLEMAYDNWLSGEPGSRRVVRDRTGKEITGMDVIKPVLPGKDLRLSIDRQLQYFADRELRKAINQENAESGSVVVMDVRSGEIRAMVNYPSYNPNDMSDRSASDGRQRNRSITDVFEPGSTMKPFTIAAALETGDFNPSSLVFTSPGRYKIGKYEISDIKDYGWLDLRGVVTKSSNVGVSKIARQLDPEQMWSVFDSFGFGRPPGSEFPGEVAGYFNHPTLWHRREQASVSYGYGISVSALQLVRAYAALANDGVMMPVSFLASDDVPVGHRVIDTSIARDVRSMLESVVIKGSGKNAQVPGYRVAGKTGTSHRSQSGGYAEDRYVSIFAGFAPVSDPQFAIAVVVHDPKAGQHFGGAVAAPVFKEVMRHGLRLDGIEPDDIDDRRAQLPGSAQQGELGDRS
ncbi:MAG: peptidoglycan D,D-transpeptidase FtsI family protein [Granulosicoccus sp.]